MVRCAEVDCKEEVSGETMLYPFHRNTFGNIKTSIVLYLCEKHLLKTYRRNWDKKG